MEICRWAVEDEVQDHVVDHRINNEIIEFCYQPTKLIRSISNRLRWNGSEDKQWQHLLIVSLKLIVYLEYLTSDYNYIIRLTHKLFNLYSKQYFIPRFLPFWNFLNIVASFIHLISTKIHFHIVYIRSIYLLDIFYNLLSWFVGSQSVRLRCSNWFYSRIHIIVVISNRCNWLRLNKFLVNSVIPICPLSASIVGSSDLTTLVLF